MELGLELNLSCQDKYLHLEGAPKRAILANKHLKINPSSPACNREPDNIRHLLFECKLAMELCNLLGLDDIIKEALQVDRAVKLVLEHLLCLPEQHAKCWDCLS